MAWIESHQSLRLHPKLYRFCSALGIEPVTGIGHLHVLWWWAAEYAKTGNLTGWSAPEIAKAAEWRGEPEHFLSALIDSHFVDKAHGVMKIHDWEEYRLYYHKAEYFRERSRDAIRKRVRRFRASRRNGSGNAPVTPPVTLSNAANSLNSLNLLNSLNSQSSFSEERACSGDTQTSPSGVEVLNNGSLIHAAEEILNFLNEKTGHQFRFREKGQGKLSANAERIVARLKSGATVEDCKMIIANRLREWKHDPKSAAWLRPSTLFGREKFEQYLGVLRK